MDTYRGVALGVESAWPDFVYDDQEKATVKPSKPQALSDLTDISSVTEDRLFHSIPKPA